MATPDPGKRLEDAREARKLSLAKAWAPVEAALGPMGCSMQQIRNYELGKVPEAEWNPLVIQVLAKVYGKRVSELSPLAEPQLDKVLVLLGGPLAPGGAEAGSGAVVRSKKRESSTMSNRSGPGRNLRRGRGPHQPEHPGMEPTTSTRKGLAA